MKWFKHDGNALADPKIEKLIMKYGIEGYGLYFACVEIIAGNLSPEKFTFELEHDAELLAYKFKIDTLLVEEMMKYMVKLELFEYNSTSNRITCSKLAKRLDISTSNNPEIKKILQNSNYKKLLATNSRLDKIRLDKTREDKTKKEKKEKKRFVKPTKQQLIEYCKEIEYDLDIDYWLDTYNGNGWLVGKDKKMKDWRATVRNWKRRNFSNGEKEMTYEERLAENRKIVEGA